MEVSYDAIYKHIMRKIDGMLDTVYSEDSAINALMAIIRVGSPEKAPVNLYSGFAVDGSMGYVPTSTFVVYDVKSALVPINLSNIRTKIVENMFLMIPSRRVRDRVLKKMSTLEAFMGLFGVRMLSNLECERRVLLVDGLITTPIYKVFRDLYSRLHVREGTSSETLGDLLKHVYEEVKNHWEYIAESLENTNYLLPSNKMTTLFYSESGKSEVLKEIVNVIREGSEKVRSHEESRDLTFETAIFVLESLENLVLRDLLLNEAIENRVSIVGIAKRSTGYSLRGLFTLLLRKSSKDGETLIDLGESLSKMLGMTDTMLVTRLLGEKNAKYLYSPFFHAYYEEPRAFRILTVAKALKNLRVSDASERKKLGFRPPYVAVSDIAMFASEVVKDTSTSTSMESLADVLENKASELGFYVGYARFRPYQRIYKFEVLTNSNPFDELMSWLYAVSVSGYPQHLSLADANAHRTKQAMGVLYGSLVDFIKKYSKHHDIIIRQIMEPHRGHLPSRGGSFIG
ncbi:MAG TPA: hypothetical protein ENF25_03380 [Thermoprotei archaeon]|nr:hypothetical protein [Thermoprotei archaeon]